MNDHQIAEVSVEYLVDMVEEAVPVGYKKTEVGVIPEDWEISSLGNLGTFKNGINKAADDFGYGSPFVNLMDVFGNPSIQGTEHLGLINATEIEKKEYSLIKGDVLFIRSSVKPAGVGLTTVLFTDLNEAVYSGFLIRFRSDKQLDTAFKEHCFSEEGFRRRVISASTVSANTNINQDSLKAIPIAFPRSSKEQTAIANALSDADALISELEKLIAKKQAIKTATMQQLLTGRTRLPQFALREDGSKKGYKPSELGEIPEDWAVVSLGDATKCLDNLRVPLNESQRSKMRGNVPYCGANGVVDWVNSYVIDDDIILMAEDGGYFDEYSTRPIAYRIVGKCWVNNHAHILQAKESFDQGYVFYSLVHKDIQKYLASGTRAKLNKSEMKKIEIITSSCKKEQTAIATILSDMDDGIQALEQRLAKTRQIKHGMMQELLTGKTRLV